MFAMKIFAKIAKKCVLGLLILSMEVSCTACFPLTNTEYIASYGNNKLPTGLYVLYERVDALFFVLQKLAEEEPNFAPTGGDYSEYYDHKIGGVMVKELISARAKEEVMMHLAVDALFSELKLTLSEESKKQLEKQGEGFEKSRKSPAIYGNGIGKASFDKYCENKMKRAQLYDYYYGEKGKDKRTDKELKDVFESPSYVKLQQKTFDYSSDEEKKKAHVSASKFFEDVKASSFDQALLKEEDEQKKKQKEAEEKRAEAEKKAKAEAEKRAKEEAEKKAKAEAEKKAKEEATKGKTEAKTEDKTGDKTKDKADAKVDEKSKDKVEAKTAIEDKVEVKADAKAEVVAGPQKEAAKEETQEERLKRLRETSTSVMSEKQMKGMYKPDEKKLIEKHPVGEPTLLDFPKRHAFVVVMNVEKNEEDFLAEKGKIDREKSTQKFETMLLARAQKLDIKFDDKVVTKFRVDKLKREEE
ncbi:hypothetical protein FACS189481_3800 [Clostridia bacterium]|nr:hypothetical protein FACS189481_3800 [Clostridia bacterium]